MKRPHNARSHQKITEINSRTGRNMPQAVATGVLLVAIIALCLFIGSEAFMYLILVFMMLGLWELRVDFATAGLSIPIIPLWVCSAATMLVMFYHDDHVAWMVVGILATCLIVAICASIQTRTTKRLARAVTAKQRLTQPGSTNDQAEETIMDTNHSLYANVGVSLLTVLYVTLLACLIVLPTTFGGHPTAHAVMMVFLPSINDIAGLAFGSWIGKHKLSPRISPSKSFEGLFGSIISCAIAACIIFAFTYPLQQLRHIWWIGMLLGALVGITGTFGDLSASLIKRDLGIKDMGHLLKGHGGVLDRVDSILMSAPLITLILMVAGL